jgi:phosphopantothenoylcysteine decarboxylase/phosphopantothenate--cysteine ligase
MGLAIAKELERQGAEVTLIMGPTILDFSANGISLVKVNTAAEMFDVCQNLFEKTDLAVMAAAVADYSPVEVAAQKIKKKEDELTVTLKKTKDILKSLGEKKKSSQVLVGFALETNDERLNAIEKLKKKNADMIVLNSLNDKGAGFGHDTNKVSLFDKSSKEFNFDTDSKTNIAREIVDTIIELYYV